MPRIGVGLGIDLLRANGLDPAASAYFAATGITGATEQQAVNTLVTSLKSAGIWSKMKAVYPFVTDNRNLLSYTEDFGNAGWSKEAATSTANQTTSPDGTQNADTFIDNSVNSRHIFYQQFSGNLATSRTFSLYAKQNSLRYLFMSVTNTSDIHCYSAIFDLQSGTVSATKVNGDATISALIVSEGNGWYRCVISGTMTTGTANYFPLIGTSDRGGFTGSLLQNNAPIYSGSGQSIYLWGAQLELGSTATTYQPIATTQQSYISSQFKYNLVNPVDSDAAFRLVFNGGWTMSAQGATPNGTNGYANTFVTNNTNLTDRASHWSMYFKTLVNDGFNGYYSAAAGAVFGVQPKDATSKIAVGLNNLQMTNVNSATGFYVGSVNSATSAKLYLNNSNIYTLGTPQNLSGINLKFYIGALNSSGTAIIFSNNQCNFTSLGNNLTDSEATALYNAVQTFNTSLSRQV